MRKERFKRLRLSLLFALIVFLVMLVSMALVLGGAALLEHFGWLTREMTGRVPLFFFAVVSLVVGAVIAFAFSSGPLRPLREIMAATDRIADGDYTVRLALKGPEDFRELSEKFNHMAEELGSVELLRTDFVNNFSHELKTPIVSIRGFAKALKWDDLTPEEHDEYLDIIISESERLSTLSANVLYLSKIEGQSILTDKKRFNVSEQLRRSAALLEQKRSEKEIEIAFDGGEHFVVGNEEMLQQVWINLLDNAIKFSPPGGKVEIRVKDTAGGVSVSVSDEGPGIPPERKARIFEKFYQGDTSHAACGNGLGLTITKEIVDRHHGTIIVRSSDKGTTFEVKLLYL